MNAMLRLTDDAIRLALTPAGDVRAPADLASGIHEAVAATLQVRRGFLDRRLTPRAALVLRLGVVALLALGLVGTLLLIGSRRVPALPPTVVTYHGGPERNGVMPGPAPAGEIRIEWQQSLKGPVGAWSPVVRDGVVYIADQSGVVSAFDEATGAPLWQVSVGAAINSGISLSDGLLLTGDDRGIIHALDITTSGVERWAFTTDRPVHSAPAIIGGTAYVGSLDGRLYALDLAAHALRWPAVETPGSVSRAVAAGADGTVYAGSGGATPDDLGSLGAYDAVTGALDWRQQLEPGNTSTPSVSDGRVFVTGGLDTNSAPIHYLYAFDATTGKALWPAPFQAPSGQGIYIGAVANGLVFLESSDGNLYMVDAATGALKGDPLPIGASLTPNGGYVDGVFYATSDDRKVHAIDVASHAESWSIAVSGVPGSPAIIDGRILVGTSLGKLVSIAGANPVSNGGASATP